MKKWFEKGKQVQLELDKTQLAKAITIIDEAERKKVAEEIDEWGEELCEGHEDYELSKIAIKLGVQRRECPICWQALKSKYA